MNNDVRQLFEISGTANVVWTIGHSTRSFDEFCNLLFSFQIQTLVDVRHYPGSRKFPHFNKEHLQESLPGLGIAYLHIPELGGRRKPLPESPNTGWRNEAFRGYADYMQTEEFRSGVSSLIAAAAKSRTSFMCSEAVWWRCHRSLISDFLKASGWRVLHIMNAGTAKEHPYTAPAVITGTEVRYHAR